MKISTEQVEFKEFCIGDKLFCDNRWWEKVADREAKVISSTRIEEIDVVKTFLGNCLVYVVTN